MRHELVTDPLELEWRLIFSIIVAGKNADFAYKGMEKLYAAAWNMLDPIAEQKFCFNHVRRLVKIDHLELVLRAAKVGNYGKIEKALRQLVDANIDLTTCAPQNLENVHGIGPKTSRFFILWTRPDYRCAALDVHVLRWLNAKGYKAPKATPQTPSTYARLEQAFLREADKAGLGPRELDHQIWAAANVGGIR